MESATIWKSGLQELVLAFGFLSGFLVNALITLNQDILGPMTAILRGLSAVPALLFWALVIGAGFAAVLISYSLGGLLGVASAALVFLGGMFVLSFGWLLLGIGAAIGFAAPLIFHDPERVDDKDELIFKDMHNSL